MVSVLIQVGPAAPLPPFLPAFLRLAGAGVRVAAASSSASSAAAAAAAARAAGSCNAAMSAALSRCSAASPRYAFMAALMRCTTPARMARVALSLHSVSRCSADTAASAHGPPPSPSASRGVGSAATTASTAPQAPARATLRPAALPPPLLSRGAVIIATNRVHATLQHFGKSSCCRLSQARRRASWAASPLPLALASALEGATSFGLGRLGRRSAASAHSNAASKQPAQPPRTNRCNSVVHTLRCSVAVIMLQRAFARRTLAPPPTLGRAPQMRPPRVDRGQLRRSAHYTPTGSRMERQNRVSQLHQHRAGAHTQAASPRRDSSGEKRARHVNRSSLGRAVAHAALGGPEAVLP
jgi:hypothetical protein